MDHCFPPSDSFSDHVANAVVVIVSIISWYAHPDEQYAGVLSTLRGVEFRKNYWLPYSRCLMYIWDRHDVIIDTCAFVVLFNIMSDVMYGRYSRLLTDSFILYLVYVMSESVRKTY